MSSFVDVAIIGAGPYGLSVAAHLGALGIDHRIFGKPMQLWRDHMPPGMRLKSDGASSDLADPADALTLKKFCALEGLPHDDKRLPIPLDTFVDYGMAFQRRFAPHLEEKFLIAIEHGPAGFTLRFDDQDVVIARRVVIAVGVSHFTFLPDFLRGLPETFVTHASRYGAFDALRGKAVTVMGAGASALDTAGLLRASGVDVSLMTRRPSIEFHNPPGHRPWHNRLRAPNSGIGSGWQLRVFSGEPLVFRALPEQVRLRKARTLLGPSAGWFMKDAIVGKVPLLTGLTPDRADARGDKLHIQARAADGSRRDIVTDHLIAGTGYRADLRRLDFLPDALRARIGQVENTPILSRDFESSVSGLYFIGPVTLNSFGPTVRFVFGARYTARRIAPALAKSLVRRPSAATSTAESVTG